MMPNEKDLAAAGGDNNQPAPAAAEPAKSTLDVLNEALANAPAEEGVAPAAAAPAADAEGDDDNAGADGADGKDAAAAAGADAGKEAAAASPAAADGKAAPAAAAPAAKAEEDPYKMPEGLGKKAQERFQGLVEQNKQKDTELAAVREELQAKSEALEWLQQNVMTDDDAADDLVMFAEYRQALRKGDFDAAQEIIAAQVRQFTLASGRTLEADPLAAFPDLQKKVADLQLDRDSAIEIARARHQGTQQQARQQHQTQVQEQQQAHQQAVQSAATAIDKMATEWAKNDPDFPAKEAIIQKRLSELMKTVPLAQVPQAVKMLYESLSEAAPAPARTPTPLRATASPGGKQAPASALDALNQGLGYS